MNTERSQLFIKKTAKIYGSIYSVHPFIQVLRCLTILDPGDLFLHFNPCGSSYIVYFLYFPVKLVSKIEKEKSWFEVQPLTEACITKPYQAKCRPCLPKLPVNVSQGVKCLNTGACLIPPGATVYLLTPDALIPLCSTFCSSRIQVHWPRFALLPDSC